jgi:hypothetical protein
MARFGPGRIRKHGECKIIFVGEVIPIVVIAGLDPAIPVDSGCGMARIKTGHDAEETVCLCPPLVLMRMGPSPAITDV